MPSCAQITLPKRPMVGYTLLPVTECEFADTHLTRWEWARREKGELTHTHTHTHTHVEDTHTHTHTHTHLLVTCGLRTPLGTQR